MSRLALVLVLIPVLASLAPPATAAAKSWCGSALVYATGATTDVRLKRIATKADHVTSRLVCAHPKGVCNGRIGKIDGRLSMEPSGALVINGSLTYKHAACGLFCQVSLDADGRADWVTCTYTCPTGSAITRAAFTATRACPFGGGT